MYTFTLFLEMKYRDARMLTTEVGSIHLSGQGLACDNPLCQGGPDVDDGLYTGFWKKRTGQHWSRPSTRCIIHNILSSIVDRYEQLLTATEMSVTDIERKSI